METLDPQLEACLEDGGAFGPMIKHPLLFTPYDEGRVGEINSRFHTKRRHYDKALAERNWSHAIALVERSYRVLVVHQNQEAMSDEAYWENVASAWMDSENIWQAQGLWRELLASPRPSRESMMDEEEKERLAELPDLIRVYRGADTGLGSGLSWTRSRETAVWFAKRYAPAAPYLYKGRVHKCAVLAYFTGRNESEVVVFPEAVMAQIRQRV